MKKVLIVTTGILVLTFLISFPISSSRAQTAEEKEFMKFHAKEIAPFVEKCSKCHTLKVELRDKQTEKLFLEKCSKCHTLERLFTKKRSVEEWHRTLDVMAGKPHANLSKEDLMKIEQWIDFMQANLFPAP